MKELLDLRYKKIVPVPVHANSDRCLVQRQQCALKFLELVQTKKRIINIDETWVDSGDFRRRCWQRANLSNSIPIKKVQPRITLVVAVDSTGELYASLLQTNSDGDTMYLFMTELFKTLDFEDKHWRQNSVIIWDGASYHEAENVLTLLQ